MDEPFFVDAAVTVLRLFFLSGLFLVEDCFWGFWVAANTFAFVVLARRVDRGFDMLLTVLFEEYADVRPYSWTSFGSCLTVDSDCLPNRSFSLKDFMSRGFWS